MSYGRLISLIGGDYFSEEDLERLAKREGDNWELQDDIDGMLADRDPSFRIGLLEEIAQGNLTALSNFGKVTDLSVEVAEGAISHLQARLFDQIEEARRGAYGLVVQTWVGHLFYLTLGTQGSRIGSRSKLYLRSLRRTSAISLGQ